MGEVVRGGEAVATGKLTRHELQRWYQPIFRGFYIPKHTMPTLRDRIVGAWLSSGRQAVIAGVAASALHGAEWVDADVAIELITRIRPQRGLIVRKGTLAEDEWTYIGRLPVTTPARTAFDLGRHLPRGQALARLDALMRATPFSIEDVPAAGQALPGRARRAPIARITTACRRRRDVTPRDAAAALVHRRRLPEAHHADPVVDERGRHVRTLDMGWEEFMVAAEYDGDQHQTNRAHYVKDLHVLPKLARVSGLVRS